MRQSSVFVASLFSVAATASAQSTGTVEARFLGDGIGRLVTVTSPVVGGSVTFQLGQYRHEFRNGTGEGAFLTGEQLTFCINFGQDSAVGWQTWDIRTLAASPLPGPEMGNFRAQAIADVWNAATGQQFTSADWAAAMQMILWDIIADYDGVSPASVDIATGSIRYNSAAPYFPTVAAHFATLRNAIGTNAPIGGLRGMVRPDFQDQLVLVPAPGPTVLALLGTGTLLGRRRRR